MATVSPLGKRVDSWPYEYQGWRVTFRIVEKPLVAPDEPYFGNPLVEHLHDDEKQLVRWTKRVQVNKKTWLRSEAEEQLCCFICAVYMPKEVWEYFERCKEMTLCACRNNE